MMNVASLPEWFRIVFDEEANATDAWSAVAAYVLEQARQPYDPSRLHNSLLPPDRALAEAAWELWNRFPETAPRTAQHLQEWWMNHANAVHGRAILIVDALSLRELPLLLALFEQKQVEPLDVRATAAEVPTDTDHFAAALRLPGRASLNSPQPPPDFLLPGDELFTAVLNHPFADCPALLPPRRDIVVWHSWLDNQLHNYSHNISAFESFVRNGLTGNGAEDFWALVQALRRGRRLLITSDHGYANTRLFIQDEFDGDTREYLQKKLHASRHYRLNDIPERNFMPPLYLQRKGFYVALGQRTWRVQGGYPELLHGGLSLLEAFVPCIELPEER